MTKKNLNKEQIERYKECVKNILEKNKLTVDVLNENDRLLFSTFGYHDCEPPNSIISRKYRELLKCKFGLWGIALNEKAINNIKAFCDNIAKEKNVYLFLNFTSSLEQAKDQEPSFDIWPIDKVKSKGNVFTHYFNDLGEEIEIPKDIIVKGSELQNKALVFEQIYYFDKSYERRVFLSQFDGYLYDEKSKCPADKLNQLYNPYFLLEKRKTNGKVILKEGKNWGIILKLKAPYIVECFKK